MWYRPPLRKYIVLLYRIVLQAILKRFIAVLKSAQGHGHVDALSAAEYLEKLSTGGETPSPGGQGSCIDTSVKISTKDNSFWSVKDPDGKLMYKGSPGVSHEATFQLPPLEENCYRLFIDDLSGKG